MGLVLPLEMPPCAHVRGEREPGGGTAAGPDGTGTARRHRQLQRAWGHDCPMAKSLVAGSEPTWLLHGLGEGRCHPPLPTSGCRSERSRAALGGCRAPSPSPPDPPANYYLVKQNLAVQSSIFKNLLASSAGPGGGRRNANTHLTSPLPPPSSGSSAAARAARALWKVQLLPRTQR